MDLLRAIPASLWPQKLVKWWYPSSPSVLIRGAAISAVMQFVVFEYLELLQFRAHFVTQANHFANGNVGTQTAALLVVVAAEFFYPLSLILIYLGLEGFLRFVSAALLGEALPSLPVAILTRLWIRFCSPPAAI